MKIAHIQHPYFPRLGYQENHLPAKQREIGHDARIFTSDYLPRTSKEDTVETGNFMYSGVPTTRLKTSPDLESIGSVGLQNIQTELEQFGPDIIHSHGLYSIYALQNAWYNFRNNTKLFVDIHIDNDNFYVDSLPKYVGYYAHRYLVLPFLKRQVSTFLPVNPYAEQFLTSELGIRSSMVKLLPLGVDTAVFSPDVDSDSLREKLGINKDEQVLISAGNLNKTKDLDVLLRAFESVVGEDSNIRLLIVGPGPEEYLRDIRELVADLGLSDQVSFCGEVPHESLPEYYNLADVGVWPGKLGITIIEAIGCGLPVIVCDSIATNFLIANDNGVNFERDDPQALSDSIHQLVSNPNEIKYYSDNAIEYAQNKLSWEKVAEQSIELYRE
jgi:glycosyltransferase involved in cell wall biosynthesis